jgi:hypothetical protein
VSGPKDWISPDLLVVPPLSCCSGDCSSQSNTTVYYNSGCYESVRGFFVKHSKALGGVSLFFFFVEIVGLISGIILLRDLKNNYGSV